MDNKGVIIHLDNDLKGILEPSKNLFDQSEIDLNYIICTTKEEFEEALVENKPSIKGLIFDLLSEDPTASEMQQNDAQFLENMKQSFAAFNIPIFVYSGYLEALKDEFDNYGTVFKISKDHSIDLIFKKIKSLFESGFIDVFCPGGILEKEIKDELNKAFTKQFSKNNQIEEVIDSIVNSGDGEDQKERVKRIFKRIAIKTLSADLLAPIADSEDKVHPIEHFYKRQSKLEIWTGDIWKKKDEDKYVVILTPRCDFAIGKAKTIICVNIDKLPKPINLNGKKEEIEKRMRDYLTDNLPGKSSRYIPSTVFFTEGGMANLADHFTIAKDSFIADYDYVITLSDDLTNEIIGKFAYYFLRTGITNINEKEFEAIIKAVQGNEVDGKK